MRNYLSRHVLVNPTVRPVLRGSLLHTYRRQYPGRTDEAVRSYPPSTSAFHEIWAGRLLHYQFRGLLSVYSHCGLHARRVAQAALYTEGFSDFVTSAAASIATG